MRVVSDLDSHRESTNPDEWVFPNEKGTRPLAHGNDWRRNIKPVADQLGHTLDVSQNVYTKVGIARQQEAVSKLADALKSPASASSSEEAAAPKKVDRALDRHSTIT